MNDSTKDAQVCTKDHAAQTATMSPSVIPQDQGVRKCPEGQCEKPFGDMAKIGGRDK